MVAASNNRVPTKESVVDEVVDVLASSGGLIDAAFKTPDGDVAVIATRDHGGPKGLFLVTVVEARFEVAST